MSIQAPTGNISLDKSMYNPGDVISWSATNLMFMASYQVAVIASGRVITGDSWTAQSPTRTGAFNVTDDMVGTANFILSYQSGTQYNTVDSKPFSVYPKGGGGGLHKAVGDSIQFVGDFKNIGGYPIGNFRVVFAIFGPVTRGGETFDLGPLAVGSTVTFTRRNVVSLAAITPGTYTMKVYFFDVDVGSSSFQSVTLSDWSIIIS